MDAQGGGLTRMRAHAGCAFSLPHPVTRPRSPGGSRFPVEPMNKAWEHTGAGLAGRSLPTPCRRYGS